MAYKDFILLLLFAIFPGYPHLLRLCLFLVIWALRASLLGREAFAAFLLWLWRPEEGAMAELHERARIAELAAEFARQPGVVAPEDRRLRAHLLRHHLRLLGEQVRRADLAALSRQFPLMYPQQGEEWRREGLVLAGRRLREAAAVFGRTPKTSRERE